MFDHSGNSFQEHFVMENIIVLKYVHCYHLPIFFFFFLIPVVSVIWTFRLLLWLLFFVIVFIEIITHYYYYFSFYFHHTLYGCKNLNWSYVSWDQCLSSAVKSYMCSSVGYNRSISVHFKDNPEKGKIVSRS